MVAFPQIQFIGSMAVVNAIISSACRWKNQTCSSIFVSFLNKYAQNHDWVNSSVSRNSWQDLEPEENHFSWAENPNLHTNIGSSHEWKIKNTNYIFWIVLFIEQIPGNFAFATLSLHFMRGALVSIRKDQLHRCTRVVISWFFGVSFNCVDPFTRCFGTNQVSFMVTINSLSHQFLKVDLLLSFGSISRNFPWFEVRFSEFP